MKIKKSLIILFSAIVVVIFVYFFATDYRNVATKETGGIQIEFSKEVESILKAKADMLRPVLMQSIVFEEVGVSNQKNKNLSIEEILALDEKFQSSNGNGHFAEQFLTNRTAKTLIEFQEDNPAFSEIFITDKFGLNVAQTNKTSDFYQADEKWWVDSFNDGRGKEHHGLIEFDESAQAEAISLYIPIIDPATEEAVGIAKAVVSIASIKMEL